MSHAQFVGWWMGGVFASLSTENFYRLELHLDKISQNMVDDLYDGCTVANLRHSTLL